jgi:hypothetical protein
MLAPQRGHVIEFDYRSRDTSVILQTLSVKNYRASNISRCCIAMSRSSRADVISLSCVTEYCAMEHRESTSRKITMRCDMTSDGTTIRRLRTSLQPEGRRELNHRETRDRGIGCRMWLRAAIGAGLPRRSKPDPAPALFSASRRAPRPASGRTEAAPGSSSWRRHLLSGRTRLAPTARRLRPPS